MSVYTQRKATYRKKLIVFERGGACEVCGYSKNLAALDFAHRDASEKKGNPAAVLQMWPEEMWRSEIDKCRVLCANCHREETHPQLNDWQYQFYEDIPPAYVRRMPPEERQIMRIREAPRERTHLRGESLSLEKLADLDACIDPIV